MVAIESLDSPSGQTICRWIENSGEHGENINHGRLYPNLDELVSHGFVEKGEQDFRTNYYALTAAGRERLASRQEFVGSVL